VSVSRNGVALNFFLEAFKPFEKLFFLPFGFYMLVGGSGKVPTLPLS
jgi:hypothetical protein